MANKLPLISVVIPAFNEEKVIAQCLKSLSLQKTKYPYEVILVNNNSTDNTSKIAAKFKEDLNLKIIFEKKQGRGQARFRGFKEAKGEIIFSGDADTLYPQSWIEKFTDKFLTSDAIAITGSCEIKDLSNFQNAIFNSSHPKMMHVYKIFSGGFWLNGFSFAIKKGAYLKSGGFNYKLQAQEDVELGLRVAKMGKIIFLDYPVTFSGRRFKRGLIFGFMDYIKSFFEAIILKKENAYLSNLR